MKAYEHRSIGDAATATATVNVGGESPDQKLLLTFGDVVSLSGDFFQPDGSSSPVFPRWRAAAEAAEGSGRLFRLAAIAGDSGTMVNTLDEIVCALKVSAVDEAVVDPRFEVGGQFAHFRFSPGANRTDVERRVRDRFLALAANNDDHFVAPGVSDVATGSGFPAALSAYHHLHQVALDEAGRLGRREGDISVAMAREAAAQHYLTDAFAAGHLRTPVADIRRFWKSRYRSFWQHLQRKVAADTARALRDLSAIIRLVPQRALYRQTLSVLTERTGQYPELSMGDLVARVFHDWDNVHGLRVDGGGVVFGDGHVGEGVTHDLALAAVTAGIDDIEIAFKLGASESRLTGQALYARVRDITGAAGEAFRAEERVPRLSADDPPQNWLAADAGALWESPMVGTTGTTVGQALGTMMEADGEFIRQVESLGQGLAGGQGMFALPVLGRWLTGKCCQAYHSGFVAPLADNPRQAVMELVADDAPGDLAHGHAHGVPVVSTAA
ncbi:MAG: hypothetical protein ACRD2W_06170 [Acidimicrobiales bacterium]